jgi:hypothetical protein
MKTMCWWWCRALRPKTSRFRRQLKQPATARGFWKDPRNFVRPFPYKGTALLMNGVFTLDCRVGSYRAFSDTEIVVSVAKLEEQFAVFTGGR